MRGRPKREQDGGGSCTGPRLLGNELPIDDDDTVVLSGSIEDGVSVSTVELQIEGAKSPVLIVFLGTI